MSYIISKTNYMNFLKHPAWLWLEKKEKEMLPPIDDETQAIFDAGHAFEPYAEALFPDGVMIGFEWDDDFSSYNSMPAKTLSAIRDGAPAIFQGRLEYNGITCIFDVLKKTGEKEYDLIEIKSSTKAKPEHYYDLAFQYLVMVHNRLEVRSCKVLHVNNEYVRKGDIDPEKLVTETDVTYEVKKLLDLTQEQIKEAKNVLLSNNRPDMSPAYVNKLGIKGTTWFSDWMKIYKYVNHELDPYSIYDLCTLDQELVETLEKEQIKLIQQIPDETKLSNKQELQVKTTKEDKPVIKKEKIKEFLETFKYPLYFLDYETISSPVPQFEGYEPYKDYPFQYSLHVLESPGGDLKHSEYLHTETSDPIPELLNKLKEDIGSEGTVLSWNMKYEKKCNEIMANLYPEYVDFLEDINHRMNDLMIPFSDLLYVHKDFYGSASIKNVMPVLAPELSYEKLVVSNGLYARKAWTEIFLEGKYQNEKTRTLKDLSDYCSLDTYAMVRIYDELLKMIDGESPVSLNPLEENDEQEGSKDEDIFPWEDVLASWKDRDNLARQAGYRNMEEAVKDIRENGIFSLLSYSVCPKCGKRSEELTLLYFSSPPWTWEHLCGRAGWMIVCFDCKYQVDFMLDVMN